MPEPFRVEVVGRGYEADANGHIAGVVLLQYAQHARWECLRAAGVGAAAYARIGVAPVSLEERIRFRRELLAGEAVTVSCRFRWPPGKTFTVDQELRRPDGGLVAEVENVGGLMDLEERRLLADPGGRLAAIAGTPGLLGLPASD
jgi:acyl-CoA thioester hydrolase